MEFQLAKFAQEWADTLAKGNKFAHRPDNKFGENLFTYSTSTGAKPSAELACKAWYDEINKYTFGSKNGAPGTGECTYLQQGIQLKYQPWYFFLSFFIFFHFFVLLHFLSFFFNFFPFYYFLCFFILLFISFFFSFRLYFLLSFLLFNFFLYFLISSFLFLRPLSCFFLLSFLFNTLFAFLSFFNFFLFQFF